MQQKLSTNEEWKLRAWLTWLSIHGIGIAMISVFLLTMLISCSGQSNKSLPADWPLPGLTLPPGAEIKRTTRRKPSGVYKAVSIHFDTRYTKAAVLNHIEKELASMGFSKGPEAGGGVFYHYLSPDSLTEVTLDTAGDRRSTYILSVDLNASPVPGADLYVKLE